MNGGIFVGALAVLLGGMAVLVPIFGLTLRFAIKPLIETWAEVQRGRSSADNTALLERQIGVLEMELQQVQHAIRALSEGQEFQRQLAERPRSIPEKSEW